MINLTLFRSARVITMKPMKRLLLATLCLLPVVTQADTTCKTDAVGITRCKDSNGVETRYRTDTQGTVRSSDGTTYKVDANGAVRGSDGSIYKTDANGIIRDNKGNTWKRGGDGSLRGSDGSICKKDPHGAVRCTE